MEGNSGGPQGVPRRISSYPPAAPRVLRRLMPPPILALPHDMPRTFKQLRLEMSNNNYPPATREAARKAYKFVAHLHSGEKRKTGTEPYTVHPITIAIRMAKMRFEAEMVCTALLHDAIEDARPGFLVTPSMIEDLFEGHPAPGFGSSVLRNVVLLTKPLLNSSMGWVFPDTIGFQPLQSRYYSRLAASKIGNVPDDQNQELIRVKKLYGTDRSTYDLRSSHYYKRLLNSGNLGAILVKIQDNLHNIETIAGLAPSQREKNVSTMINNTLLLAQIFLTPLDVKYVRDRIEAVCPDLVPPLMERPLPKDIIVTLPKRNRLDLEALLSHPNPEAAYISIYGSDVDAFVSGYVEIGIPPRLPIDYQHILEDHLPGSLSFESKKSMVPITVASHEMIFRIGGFNSGASAEGGLSNEIRFSDDSEEFVEVLDANKGLVIRLPVDSFPSQGIKFGSGLSEQYSRAQEKYQEMISGLRRLFEGKVRPELERLQPNPYF